MTDELTPNLCALPPLDVDGVDDATFRVTDRLWQAVGVLFDRYEEEQNLSYAALANRIGKSRHQVHRWLSAPCNMTVKSAGLLAEGLDADLEVYLTPRGSKKSKNYAHPCVRAQESLFIYETKSSVRDDAQTLRAISSPADTRTSPAATVATSFVVTHD